MEDSFLLPPGSSFSRPANKLLSCSFVISFPSASVGLFFLTLANNAADSSPVKDLTSSIEDSNFVMACILSRFGFVSPSPTMLMPFHSTAPSALTEKYLAMAPSMTCGTPLTYSRGCELMSSAINLPLPAVIVVTC